MVRGSIGITTAKKRKKKTLSMEKKKVSGKVGLPMAPKKK